MKVVTAEQIRELDRRAMQEFGIPGVVLMENAGRAVVDVMQREYGMLAGKRIAVFCGTGNNGGDGFVIARLLHLLGAKVNICLGGFPHELKGDAAVHYEVLRHLELPELTPNFVGLATEEKPRRGYINQNDLLVDALLGTGIREAPREPYARIIEAINAVDVPVIAVDLPSGVNADTGATPGAAIRAAHTVTFAYPKLGLFQFPGAAHVGKLHVADIGFDWKRLDPQTSYRLFTVPGTSHEETAPDQSSLGAAAKLLQKRYGDANKGDYGHVAIVAGSRGMCGAPALVARAAQHVGAGLVTVLAAESAQPTIASKLDEQMTIALPEEDGAISEAAFDTIAEFARKATVLCVGPGLTTKPHTQALIHRLIAEIDKPLVLDADGLNALAQLPDMAAKRPTNPAVPLILTPHPGEAARLLNKSIDEVQADRVGAVRELARRFQAIALLKGRYTLIANPAGEIIINTTGNPGMATGGSGDTLTGILGGLVAQNARNFKSQPDLSTADGWTQHQEVVSLGVYVHGVAGDMAAQETGEQGLVAGDIIAHLSRALRALEEKR